MLLIIKGIPLQKQSAKFVRTNNFIRSYQPKKVVDWMAQARLQIIEQLPDSHIPYDNEVIINRLVFVFPPLKSWSKTKMKQLESGVVLYKSTKPDLDNLQKQIFDCCTGLVFVDDSRIVRVLQMEKVFGVVPRIEMDVYEL